MIIYTDMSLRINTSKYKMQNLYILDVNIPYESSIFFDLLNEYRKTTAVLLAAVVINSIEFNIAMNSGSIFAAVERR